MRRTSATTARASTAGVVAGARAAGCARAGAEAWPRAASPSKIRQRGIGVSPRVAAIIAWIARRFRSNIAGNLPDSGKGQMLANGGGALPGEVLDRIDVQLLDCLQHNNLQTADQLAEQVGRSPSVVARRLRRLRASGAIAAEVAILSQKVARDPLFAAVHVQFERHSTSDIARFKQRVCASANVQTCLQLAGPFDLLLIVVAGDMDDYNAFATAMLEAPPVHRFET